MEKGAAVGVGGLEAHVERLYRRARNLKWREIERDKHVAWYSDNKGFHALPYPTISIFLVSNRQTRTDIYETSMGFCQLLPSFDDLNRLKRIHSWVREDLENKSLSSYNRVLFLEPKNRQSQNFFTDACLHDLKRFYCAVSTNENWEQAQIFRTNAFRAVIEEHSTGQSINLHEVEAITASIPGLGPQDGTISESESIQIWLPWFTYAI